MPPTSATARDAFTESVALRAASSAGPDARGDIEEFARLFIEGLGAEDLDERGVDYMGAAIASHWACASERPAGSTLVRAYAPVAAGAAIRHSVVEIVTDDMPFVVDSVSMEIARHGLGVHLVVHPIVSVRRNASGHLLGLAADVQEAEEQEAEEQHDARVVESFVRVEVDRETDAEVLDALRDDLLRVLRDVRSATNDWTLMLDTMRRVIDGIAVHSPPIPAEDLAEGRALLEWMADQHFTFLGYREYELGTEGGGDVLRVVPGTGLGILRDRINPPGATSFARLSPEGRRKAREPQLLVLTKANSRSTVHRPSYLDYVGVKRFDAAGEVIGEHRFLGIYTSAAYNTSPLEIPLLRHKVAAVVERAGFPDASHSQKDLIAILETYPRDDLFQVTTDELFEAAMGILALQERRRVRLFARRDSWGRFVTCLVFVPRDRYTTALRLRIAEILTGAFVAVGHEFDARVSESVLARLHYVLHLAPDAPASVDLQHIESLVAEAARSWHDSLREALISARGEEDGLALAHKYAEAFPAAYLDDVPPTGAPADIARIESLVADGTAGPAVRLTLSPAGHAAPLEFTIFGAGAPLPLSDVMPLMQNLGVSVIDEHPYVVKPARSRAIWIGRFGLRPHDEGHVTEEARDAFQDAFVAMLRGDAENDGLQRLVLAVGLRWRQITVLRAYSRYLRQTGTLFSQAYIADALVAQPHVAKLLVELFEARFDPDVRLRSAEECGRIVAMAGAALDAVASLDEDRILRGLLALVLATTRTTYFRPHDAGIESLAFKFDPSKVPDLPPPRPKFEIFVYSTRVEGVHLRAGRVARGGIRWSDRREDFRTEVLGLMKAQTVKNAVIVPVGAKGGFVVKRPPVERDALATEVAACYRIFISALLDLTDNLAGNGVLAPARVVRHDSDDPYLVVAADKGTASFSDIANEIASARGFWLGDAFASGGSRGYDHKKMAITARGAWKSVESHFCKLGLDPLTTDFTAIGIGDMSGDVFGNGMLLAPHIRLVAAFDHRHIFLDPDPDTAASFTERQRLFSLPRSSWDDYDRTVISEGGGVYPRSSKSIALSPPVRARLATTAEALTPSELIRAILLAPVDLLWNGGIGTYVKASYELDSNVGDKANDTVRVDGRDLRCRVVVEGGNLGLTQRGRVEFALAGGLVNTDAIDNSAGVDCSDHEVNIKILLDSAVADGDLDPAERDPLLVRMTGEIAELVLRDNYRQNRALANALAQSSVMEDVHARHIGSLVQQGHLDRLLESLPDDAELVARRRSGAGLTTPELAVLLSYTKISIESEILESDVPDDPDFASELIAYFPGPLQERFAARIRSHPLRREIVATSLANSMVNRAGISFAFRLAEETGAGPSDIVRAHKVAWEVLDQKSLWVAIEALDRSVDLDTQTLMYLESRKLVERATRWLLRHRRRPIPVAATIEVFRQGLARSALLLPDLLLGNERAWLDSCSADLAGRGVPADLARRVAGLESLFTGFDLTDIAAWSARKVEEVAPVYCLAGERLQLDWLRDRIVELPRDDRWQSLARIALRDDAYSEHRAIAGDILTCSPPGARPDEAFETWLNRNAAAAARATKVVEDVRSLGIYDISTLSVALREIRNLVQAEG